MVSKEVCIVIFHSVILVISVSSKVIPKLLLISIDGLRYDFVQHEGLSTLQKFMRWTFVPHVEPVFPSKTIPNHMSMVTGLYTESHGVLGPFLTSKGLIDVNDTSYWIYNSNIVPLWALNERVPEEGRISGCMMWPGCEHIFPPTYFVPYNKSMSWNERCDTVIDWLTSPVNSANLVLVYLEEPDLTAHIFGPESPQVLHQLKLVDQLLSRLIFQLKQIDLLPEVNIVLTSDHGSVSVRADQLIDLDLILSPDIYIALGPNPVLRILPRSGLKSGPSQTDDMLYIHEKLRNGSEHAAYRVFVHETIPDRWHYKHNPRVSPILLVADEGHLFLDADLNRTLSLRLNDTDLSSIVLGNHGYDPAFPSMHHPLMARGPAFRRSSTPSPYTSPSLNNVDTFLLCAAVLKIADIPPNNASWRQIEQLLVQSWNIEGSNENLTGTSTVSTDDPDSVGSTQVLWLSVAVLTSVVAALAFATCVCLRRRSRNQPHYFAINRTSGGRQGVLTSDIDDDTLDTVALHAIADDDSDEVHYLLPTSSRY